MSIHMQKDQYTIDKPTKTLFDLTYDATNKCVQCGYCLPVCPTYATMGKESASPRGRINLVKIASEGKINLQEHLAEPLDLCLGCRACEVACPVGVPYGQILESAKRTLTEVENNQSKVAYSSRVSKMILKQVFPYPQRIRLIGNAVWVYQKSGLAKLVRKTKIINKVSESMGQLEQVLPPLESPFKRNKRGTVIPAQGEKKARVAFFTGCIMEAMMHRINRLTIELLTLVGCEVVIPVEQNCCGALHAHQGLAREAKDLAQANIKAFEQSGADYYINNAGGCGAMLSEYDHLFNNDPAWFAKAQEFVSKSRDISEILFQFGPLPFNTEWKGIITYQDSCHLRNVQGVSREPRQLLHSIPGATFVELEGSELCCASGGIYNLLHFQESMKILNEKMDKVKLSKATTVVTSNPGCQLQMRLGVERSACADQMQAVHIVEVLAKACGLE